MRELINWSLTSLHRPFGDGFDDGHGEHFLFGSPCLPERLPSCGQTVGLWVATPSGFPSFLVSPEQSGFPVTTLVCSITVGTGE